MVLKRKEQLERDFYSIECALQFSFNPLLIINFSCFFFFYSLGDDEEDDEEDVEEIVEDEEDEVEGEEGDDDEEADEAGEDSFETNSKEKSKNTDTEAIPESKADQNQTLL